MSTLERSTLRMRHGLLAAWLTCALAYPARPARAGNDEGILVGGQAALTAGALTATVSDGSASWYNPAGLARIEGGKVDINASVYGVSLVSSDRLFTLPDGTHTEASATDWQLIPSALSYVRQVSERSVMAFSIIVPSTSDIDLRALALESDGTRWTFGVDSLRNEYDYIVSIGTRLREGLLIGFSLHGIYISTERKTQIGRGTPGDSSAPFETYSTHYTLGDYGLRMGLGLQWMPSPRFALGVALQTPTLTGFRDVRSSTIRSSFADAVGSFSTSDRDELNSVWELSTPLSLRVGFAYSLGSAQLLLDGSLLSPLDSPERALDRKLTGNARAAVMLALSQQLSVGLGAFTDLSGARTRGADYAGVAGGVRMVRPYRMADGARELSFMTMLAGRYAYGWGRTQGVRFDAEGEFALTQVPFRAHELAFNLGGGVNF
jgi:hypothetical protein